jgi:NADPH:quinone reductase-like Zn-dependent oxidoreductase
LIAIKVCQQINCRIFTTSSSDEKRRFLRENYDIPDAHIFNPNDPNFVDEILVATHGIGVDVVFNSLSSDKLVSIYRIVANYGRYIEIDNYDQTPNNQLLRNILYYNISSIISEETFESLIPKIFKGFAKWFYEGLENGLQLFLTICLLYFIELIIFALNFRISSTYK